MIIRRDSQHGGTVDAGDFCLKNLSAFGETLRVELVKLGERPGLNIDPTPSQAFKRKLIGRCREQTAGT